MRLRLPGWARDKRAQLAVGGGAIAGVVVLLRHHSSAGGQAAATTASGAGTGGGISYGGSVPGGSTGVPTFSDGGAGLSADLGNFQTGLQGILNDYTSQLTSTLGALQQVPSGGSTPASPTPVNPAAPPKSPAAGQSAAKAPAKPAAPAKAAAPTTPAAVAKPTVITISKGQTLTGIAQQYGTTVGALASANKITNPNKIQAGAKLTVPAATAKKK